MLRRTPGCHRLSTHRKISDFCIFLYDSGVIWWISLWICMILYESCATSISLLTLSWNLIRFHSHFPFCSKYHMDLYIFMHMRRAHLPGSEARIFHRLCGLCIIIDFYTFLYNSDVIFWISLLICMILYESGATSSSLLTLSWNLICFHSHFRIL